MSYDSDYDWKNALYCAGLDLEDIDSVTRRYPGCNDDDHWLMYGQLKNGKFFALTAWCDYTGWDCRAGGDLYFGDSSEEVYKEFTIEQQVNLEEHGLSGFWEK